MGKLYDLVEAYRDRYAPHRPSERRVAMELGVSPQTLANWRTPTKLLAKKHLEAIVALTGVPYQRVLDALLEDIGYLHEEQSPAVAARRTRSGGPSAGQERRRQLGRIGEETQARDDDEDGGA